ncbi:hypothetical protein M0R72_06290 [Candidatus Pacearchaeota archaeon]|nr:hypothetical protein [Candidatus Pacearchaeota archaeon]
MDLRKALARRRLERKRRGTRVVFDSCGAKLVRGTVTLEVLKREEMHDPLAVVTRVMRLYRGYESSVASIPCLTGEQAGAGPITREEKLAYIGKVNGVLSRINTTGERLIRMMHPANAGGVDRQSVAIQTGLPNDRVMRCYQQAAVKAAAGFLKGGLYEEKREAE